ncbi:hypothetical protein [Nitrososphaera sp.]|uniref:hypothetical protein n=1 Tax=Nitrososphaera sp. TaxID=1971748 RepID=UPI0031758B61
MCDDIGEILGRLKQKSVFDYESRRSVLLSDKKAVDIEYKKNDLLEVKRFVELVSRHLPALTYLVRNPINESLPKEVERSDRIMGSISYSSTARLRQRTPQSSSNVMCLEIHRSFDTPENRILALILLSIANYCDRYTYLEGLAESRNQIEPTVEDLKKIRVHVTSLLSSKAIRQVLTAAVSSTDQIDQLFVMMSKRIRENRIPAVYLSIIKLLFYWRHRLYIRYNDISILKDVLFYHSLKLKDKNKLYEAWVFYHLLDRLIDHYRKRFVEISGIDDAPVFATDDRSVLIRYQPSYLTGWVDANQPIYDTPDIVIEFDNNMRFVVDAKNSHHLDKYPRPNFRQMRSYLSTTDANVGVFIHSEADDTSLWKVVKNNTSKTVIWTSFSPNVSNAAVDDSNIIKLIEFIKEMHQKIPPVTAGS